MNNLEIYSSYEYKKGRLDAFKEMFLRCVLNGVNDIDSFIFEKMKELDEKIGEDSDEE